MVFNLARSGTSNAEMIHSMSGSGSLYGTSNTTTPSPRQTNVPIEKKPSNTKEEFGVNLELGELEQLTITNDNETTYDVSFTTIQYIHIPTSS